MNLGKAVAKFGKRYKDYKRRLEEQQMLRITTPEINIDAKTGLKGGEEEEKGEKKEYYKIGIGDVKKLSGKGIKEEESLRDVDITYPLTPVNPKRGKKIYAWCATRWDSKSNSLIYNVREPHISLDDIRSIERLKKIIEETIDVDFKTVKKEAAIKYLKDSINKIIGQFGLELGPEKQKIYEYYIIRDFLDLGKIQPILNDENIEDISCDGINLPIFVNHRDPKFGSLKTNVSFGRREELDELIIKLSQRCEKSISVAEPLLQGALPGGSRVQATLGVDIARRGSNFTIRKFTKEPLTPIHLLNFDTVDVKTLAYLWLLIEYNNSILVSGSTASGKTSLLNALSLFIRPTLKIVSIEDTPELRLPHVHWVPEVSRESFGGGVSEKKHGEVSLFDLLKGSLRQRPDYIIVGEVRGKEAFVLFQQMATGHAGLATLHATSLEKVIDRLITPPINLPPSLLETLDAMVFIKRTRRKGEYVRKISEVLEIVEYDNKKKDLISNKVVKWNAATNKFNNPNGSYLLGKISETFGIKEGNIKRELYDRMKVLSWMQDKYITHYKQVSKVINAYYSRREDLMALIEAE